MKGKEMTRKRNEWWLWLLLGLERAMHSFFVINDNENKDKYSCH